LTDLISAEKDMEVVGCVHDGLEALTMTAELLPDVLILDLVLPKHDGLEVLRRLPETGAHCRIIVLSGFVTKTNRKRLTGAYSSKSPLVAAFKIDGDEEFVLYSTENRAIVFSTVALSTKSARDTQGVAVMSLKTKYKVSNAMRLSESSIQNPPRYKTKSIPAAGARLNDEDRLDKQMTLGEV